MRQPTIILSFLILPFILSSCTYEEAPVIDPDLSVRYEFFTGPHTTLVEGFLINSGNTFIDDAEIQIKYFDEDGYLLDVDWFLFDTDLQPGQEMRFHVDYPVAYTHVAEVSVYDIW
jgi:hypothetical protein